MDYNNCTIIYVDDKKQAQVVKIVDGQMNDPFRQLVAQSVRLLKKMQRAQNRIDSGMLDKDELNSYTDIMSKYIDDFKTCHRLIDEGLQVRRDFMDSYNNAGRTELPMAEYITGCIANVSEACTDICHCVDIHDRCYKNWTGYASEFITESVLDERYSFSDIFDQWHLRISHLKCPSLKIGMSLALKKSIGDLLNRARRVTFDNIISCNDDYNDDYRQELCRCYNQAEKLYRDISEKVQSRLIYDGNSLKIGVSRCSVRPVGFHELPENTLEMKISYNRCGKRFGFLNKRYIFTRDVRRLAENCRKLIKGDIPCFDFDADYGRSDDFYSIKVRRYHHKFMVTESIYDELSYERLYFTKEMSTEEFSNFADTFELWKEAYPVKIPDNS